MPEEIITRDSAAFKELYRDIVKAIRAVDILIDTHRPTIGNELYLTSEEICSIFSISKRSLQNYRDNRQIGKHGKIDPVGTDEIDPVKTA